MVRRKKDKVSFKNTKGGYIEEGENFKRLSDLGLMPGTSFYFKDVQVTKQKGFGKFNIAGYWKRRYRSHGEDERRASRFCKYIRISVK